MYTKKDAEKDGWVFEVNGEDGTATKYVNEDGEDVAVAKLDASSGIPLFVLISEVAAAEGQPLFTNENSAEVITPAFVKKVSGETYSPSPPEPPAAPMPTEAQRFAAGMAETISTAVSAVPDTGSVADLKNAIVTALAPYQQA